MDFITNIFKKLGKYTISSIPEGADALLLAELVHNGKTILHVARDDARMAAITESLNFFSPDIEVLNFPAWDCMPYDRVSPNSGVASKRLDTLAKIVNNPKRRVIITTANSIVQRVLPPEIIIDSFLELKKGQNAKMEKVIEFLSANGYIRTSNVTDHGEFAVRGSIIDIFPSTRNEPVRIDFFGDNIEDIRLFDPITQVTSQTIEKMELIPANEVIFKSDSKERFSNSYRELFGAITSHDPLYEAVMESRKYAGMEHWLPLFYERMETLFGYLPQAVVTYDPQADQLVEDRLDQIKEYYDARQDFSSSFSKDSDSYKPLPPEYLYMDAEEFEKNLAKNTFINLSTFQADEQIQADTFNASYKKITNFYMRAKHDSSNPFELFANWQTGKKIIIACFSEGSRSRTASILLEHGIQSTTAESWKEALESKSAVTLIKLKIKEGFAYESFYLVSEQDLFGERFVRNQRKKLRPEKFLTESYNLSVGEIIVHEDHGIGRFDGLETLTVGEKNHDCIKLTYAGGDRLYIPVENIDAISRYGNADSLVELDRLGSVSWQSRKARLKERIKLAAEEIIKVAALRMLKKAEELHPHQGVYDEFCARFPYTETEDQQRAIDDIITDLSLGRPMNRLICGDVGFGKTEVALRAAFIALGDRVAGNSQTGTGGQVAIVTPTTLLCRQHYKTFSERFAGLPVKVRQLSRMVSAKEATETKKMIKSGEVDIVIGTHALLSKNIDFAKLELVVIDEEQHFGVAQKEHLKKLRGDVHVLTLSATPIPRTMQMSLTGIRELSLIATPPVDRLAVRTYVMPYDPVILREAILRERARGGKTFYVCPRIKDLEEVNRKLEKFVPEVKIAIANGQMKPQEMDKVMNDFYDGKYDVLLSTSIIESGIDIPTANTIIIHKSELFGLAQLYQLRGRVGRSNVRAYSYFTLSHGKNYTKEAMQRLEVMQKLDSLGAGFTLATYDMDIRGFGNLLGDEQSGNIKEVGVELYQQMLTDTIEELKVSESGTTKTADNYSPQINLGISVLIPEKYIPDLSLRLGIYRRIADLKEEGEIESIAAELIDRFGALPEEVDHLLQVVKIKQLCRKAGIEKVEAGPKGAVFSFRHNKFARPEALIKYLSDNIQTLKLRADHKLVITQQSWEDSEERIKGLKKSVNHFVELAA